MKNLGLLAMLGALVLLGACGSDAERDDPVAEARRNRVDARVRPVVAVPQPTPAPAAREPIPQAPSVLPTTPEAADAAPAADAEGLRTHTEEEDFDGDGIADTRTIRHFQYDAAGRPCRLVTERDFDADGKIDARTTSLSSYGAGTCGS